MTDAPTTELPVGQTTTIPAEHSAIQGMQAAGVNTEIQAQVDYFGTDETDRVSLPDGVSFVDLKVLTEGDRRKYLNATNRDLRVQRQTGDMFMRVPAGEQRKELLKGAIQGWNLVRYNKKTEKVEPIQFSTQNLDSFLTDATPGILEIIEKKVYEMNPWLMQDMSVEDIDKEIERLNELREVKAKEEEGKAS